MRLEGEKDRFSSLHRIRCNWLERALYCMTGRTGMWWENVMYEKGKAAHIRKTLHIVLHVHRDSIIVYE